MKYFSTLISALVISSGLLAQTPNSGFETWTHNSTWGYDTPNSWDNANTTTYVTGVYTCAKATGANVHSGTAALELVTQTYLGNTAPGIATTGTINTSTQAVTGGIAYTGRPDSITGYYKYTSVTGDQGFVMFTLFGSTSTDTVAQAYFTTPASTVSSYTRFSQALVYRNSDPVVTSQWIILSSLNQTSGKVGSQLFVDDIGLVSNPTGISNIQPAKGISVGPNPVKSQVYIVNNENSKATFILYDITGRKIAENVIGASTNLVDVTTVPAGLYIYSIVDESNAVIKTGKLIIQQ